MSMCLKMSCMFPCKIFWALWHRSYQPLQFGPWLWWRADLLWIEASRTWNLDRTPWRWVTVAAICCWVSFWRGLTGGWALASCVLGVPCSSAWIGCSYMSGYMIACMMFEWLCLFLSQEWWFFCWVCSGLSYCWLNVFFLYDHTIAYLDLHKKGLTQRVIILNSFLIHLSAALYLILQILQCYLTPPWCTMPHIYTKREESKVLSCMPMLLSRSESKFKYELVWGRVSLSHCCFSVGVV